MTTNWKSNNQGTANSESETKNPGERPFTDIFSGLFTGFANGHEVVSDDQTTASPFDGLEKDAKVYEEIAEFIHDRDPVLQNVVRGGAPMAGGVIMLTNKSRVQYMMSEDKQKLHLIIHHDDTPEETMRFVFVPRSHAEAVDFITGSQRYPAEPSHGDATEEFQMLQGVLGDALEQKELASAVRETIGPVTSTAKVAFEETAVAAAEASGFFSDLKENNVTSRITDVFEGLGRNVASIETQLQDLLPVLTDQVQSTMTVMGNVCIATGAIVAICALVHALAAAIKTHEQFQKGTAAQRAADRTPWLSTLFKTAGAMLLVAGIGYVGYRSAGILMLQYERWLIAELALGDAAPEAFRQSALILGHLPTPTAHVNEGGVRRFSGTGIRLDSQPHFEDGQVHQPQEVKDRELLQHLRESFHMHEQFQGASDTSASLMALLVAITKTIHDPKIDGWKCFQDLMKDSKNFKVLLSSTEAIVDLIPEQIRLAVYEKFGFGGPEDITTAQKELISECYFLHNYMMDHHHHTANNKKLWMDAFSRLSNMLGNSDLMGPQKSTFAKTLSSHIHTLMSGQVQRISEIPDNQGFRLRTTSVWLSGIQGSGKSQFITHLCSRFGARYPLDRRCHVWSTSDAYDSGYKGQWALDIDDVGSNIPALQKKAFFQNLLTMASTKPMQMNMAFDKGMPFESHALFLSSNEPPDHILAMAGAGNCLTNPDAVKRRFTGNHGIMAEVTVQPEFMHRNHDNKLVPNAQMIEASANEHPNEFRWMRFVVEGNILTAADFMNLFANCYSSAMMRYKHDSEARGADMGPDLLVGALNDVADHCKVKFTGEQFQMMNRVNRKLVADGKAPRPRRSAGGALVAGPHHVIQNPEAKQVAPQPSTVILSPLMQAKMRRRVADYISVPSVDKNATLEAAMKLGYLQIGKNQKFSPAQQLVILQQMERTMPIIFGNVNLPGPEPERGEELAFELKSPTYKGVLPGTVALAVDDAAFLCHEWKVELGEDDLADGKHDEQRRKLIKALPEFLFFLEADRNVVLLNLSPRMVDYLIAHISAISDAACNFMGLGRDGNGLSQEELKALVDDEIREVVAEENDVVPPIQRFSFDWFKDKATDCWRSLTASVEALLRKIASIDWLKLGKVLAATLGITALIVKGWSVYKDWTRGDSSEQHQSRDENRESDTKHGPYRAPSRHGPRKPPGQTFQMLAIPEEPFLAQLNRNTVTFSPHPNFDERNCGTAVFLVGKRMMLNSHYLDGKTFPCEVSYMVQDVEFNSTMKEEDIHWLTNDADKKTDICVWQVPHNEGRVPSDFPKITQHFPLASELKKKYYTSEEGGETVYLLSSGAKNFRNVVKRAVRTPGKFSSLRNNDGEALQMDETFEYVSDKGFVRGDCGSVLTDGRKILGIHLCGKGMTDDHYPIGVSQVVTKEEISTYFSKFQMRNDELDDCSLDQLPEDSRRGEDSDMWGMPLTGDFLVEASIRLGNKTPTKTKYLRTGLDKHGSKWAGLCAKVPVVLSPSDPRYTGTATTTSQFMADQLGRYAKIPPSHDPVLLNACMSKLVHAIPKSKLPAEHRGVWTLHQALNPRLVGSILKPLPLSTSAGALHEGPGKRRYIVFDEMSQQYHATPELEREVKTALSLVAEGKNPLFVFSDFPKDELMTPEKIHRKHCRTVSASPVDLSVITKMAFGAFVDAFQRENFNWGHMVGVDVMSRDWDSMIKKLLEVSPVGFDGDFKAFDSTMGPQFMRAFFDHVDDWYKRNGIWSEADSRLRWVCVYNVMFSKHLVGRTIVRLMFGNKSGAVLTTVKNCFHAKYLLMYSFVMLSVDDRDAGTRHHSLQGYDRLVGNFVMGDDNFNAVHPSIPWYNAKSVAQVLSKIGVTYTPAAKNGQLSSSLRSLFELEFLSNTTVIDDFIPGMSFYPFIKADSLSKCVAWVKKSAQLSHSESVDTNIQQSLARVFLSGRERFEDFRRDTVDAFNNMVPDSGISFYTWDELVMEYSPLNQKYCEQFHGLTVSTTKNNIGSVQGGGVEMNQENKFETKTDVHAKAGNDSPNVPATLASVLRQPAPPGSSGERVDFLPSWAITNKLEGANLTTANTGDDMSLKALTQPGFRTAVQWQVGQGTGTILWQAPIFPNSVLYTEQFSLTNTTLPTALASVASLYGLWRGGIQYGFNAITSSIATGRLGVAVNYGVGPPPVTLGDLTSQRYVVFEVSGENKKAVVEVPYVATTRLKEVYSGQHLDSCSTGYITLFVMNGLRAPSSCSNVVEVNVSEGAAPDLEFSLPFSMNNSIRYVFEDSPPPDEDGFHQIDLKEEFQMMASGTPQVQSVRSGFESPIVMHSEGDVSAPVPDPIMATPQTLTLLLRRSIPVSVNNDGGVQFNKWFTTGSLFGQGKNPWQMYSVIDKIAKFFRVWAGTFNMLAYSKYRPIAMAYYPLVATEPTSRGIFTQGDATGSQTNFAQAFSFAPDDVGYTGGVVPFTSIQNCCLVPHFLSEVGTQSNTGVVQYETGTDNTPLTVTFSAGDGFRFGVRFAIPLMRTGVSNVTPDNWPEPAELKERFQMNSGDATIGGDEKVGVVLTDSSELAPTEVQAVVPGTGDTKIIGQPQLDFLAFLRRDQWVANFDWSITSQKGTILYDRPVPSGLLFNTALRAYQAFRQHKLDAYATVKVQATGFHSGRLLAMTSPMTAPTESRRTFFGVGSTYPTLEYRRNQTFAEHVFIDAAASASVTLRIPFRYFKPYLENGEDFAQFYIGVFNQLRVGDGGDATASVTVYIRFEAADLRVINPL